MSVAVQHEDTEALAAWGMGLSRVQERCIFCRAETRYWYSPKNQPCCQACAATKDAADFEKKVEMVEEIKDLTQARRVITQLRGLVAERDNMLGKRPCQNSRCNELIAARALLREVIADAGIASHIDACHRAQEYLDACDTLEGNKPVEATGCRKCGDILPDGDYCKAPACPLNPSMKGES